MLKLERSGSILRVFLAGAALFIMACDKGGTEPPTPTMGCEEIKELKVALPSAEEAGSNIKAYKIEVLNPTSPEESLVIEGMPGEIKTIAVVDTDDPLKLKVTAIDPADNQFAVGESTAAFSMDHDGLLCDLVFEMDIDPASLSSMNATIDINVDCHLIDIVEGVVEFVDDSIHNIVDVTTYVVDDTVEDFFNIIDILRPGN